jgi:hypothetical protein
VAIFHARDNPLPPPLTQKTCAEKGDELTFDMKLEMSTLSPPVNLWKLLFARCVAARFVPRPMLDSNSNLIRQCKQSWVNNGKGQVNRSQRGQFTIFASLWSIFQLSPTEQLQIMSWEGRRLCAPYRTPRHLCEIRRTGERCIADVINN